MTYTVYIDAVFAVNTVMDLLVLAAAGRILGYRARKIRLAAGALAGGIWSCLALFWQGSALVMALITYGGMGTLMAVIAFPVKGARETARAVGCIYMVSVVLAGVMLALERLAPGVFSAAQGMEDGMLSLLLWIFLAAGGAFGVFGFSGEMRRMVRDMARRRDMCRVVLQFGDRREEVSGLIDTGNRLREPVSGCPVHVAEAELMERLCPAVQGVIFIPYRSVGGQGMLPAVFIDAMEVRQEKESWHIARPLIAVTKRSLSPEGEYHILIQKA